MLALAHVDASGRLDAFWQFDPARRLVLARVHVASSPYVDVEIPVCLDDRPRLGAWSLVRLSEETWQLTAGCFEREPGGEMLARARRVHERVPLGAINLTNAPMRVSDEMRAL